MRGVDALIAKLSRCFPQSLPRIDQVFGKITREVFFRRGPAIVRRSFFNLLLAVIALSGCRRHVLGRHYFCSVPRPFEGVSAGHTDYVFLFLQFVIGSLDVAFDTPEYRSRRSIASIIRWSLLF